MSAAVDGRPPAALPLGCQQPEWPCGGGVRLDSRVLTRPRATLGPMLFARLSDASEVYCFWRQSWKAVSPVQVEERWLPDGLHASLWLGDQLAGAATLSEAPTTGVGTPRGKAWLVLVNAAPAPDAAPAPFSGLFDEGQAEEIRAGISDMTARVGAMAGSVEAGLTATQAAEALQIASAAVKTSASLAEALAAVRDGLRVSFTYSNHRGVVEQRSVRIIGLRYGSSVHYKQDQWLLRAWCYDREAERDFSLGKILDWGAPA